MLASLHQAHVLPDLECATGKVSQSLLPVLHRLKWSLQCDQIAKLVREGSHGSQLETGTISFGPWFERRGRGVVQDSRVFLALCPDSHQIARKYGGANCNRTI